MQQVDIIIQGEEIDSMREHIENRRFDEERALYHLQSADVSDCTFAGPADGESALKETRDVRIDRCTFSLRYPLWHAKGFELRDSSMDEYARAALWYADDGVIENTTLDGIKAVRECNRITLRHSRIHSPEFGWKSTGIMLEDCVLESEYAFLDSRDVKLQNVKMKGKYAFQYMHGLKIVDSELDTKDAFWHSENVTVQNSLVKGEYLGWFSTGLTLINCHIVGTQPLCYCKDLRLVDCTMEGTDLAFEYSDVVAEVRGGIDSVKNPRSGTITADSVGEVVYDNPIMECEGKIVIRQEEMEEESRWTA